MGLLEEQAQSHFAVACHVSSASPDSPPPCYFACRADQKLRAYQAPLLQSATRFHFLGVVGISLQSAKPVTGTGAPFLSARRCLPPLSASEFLSLSLSLSLSHLLLITLHHHHRPSPPQNHLRQTITPPSTTLFSPFRPPMQRHHRSSPPASPSEPLNLHRHLLLLLLPFFLLLLLLLLPPSPNNHRENPFSSPVSCFLCLTAGYHPTPPRLSSSPPHDLALRLSSSPLPPSFSVAESEQSHSSSSEFRRSSGWTLPLHPSPEFLLCSSTQAAPEENCSAKPASKGEGLRQYYSLHIHELQLFLRQKTHNLNRLEAQRNELNFRVRMLREELQFLQEPGSYVGEVVKVMGKNKVLVKVHPEGKYVVDIDKDVNITKITQSQE
ncbi:hypothetical protein Ahy_A08g041323 isoform C [Arachis hypogaea]|uniref:Proteasomal ATPase second OB domain-containing protein n=1 Tax=Arachis hypogaea TaxID=3818 RepID=A0A445C2F0_ARAHY|nr:hypothetical protein Ahy_A08g041323 isoform C [Arachis hypogaea]